MDGYIRGAVYADNRRQVMSSLAVFFAGAFAGAGVTFLVMIFAIGANDDN